MHGPQISICNWSLSCDLLASKHNWGILLKVHALMLVLFTIITIFAKLWIILKNLFLKRLMCWSMQPFFFSSKICAKLNSKVLQSYYETSTVWIRQMIWVSSKSFLICILCVSSDSVPLLSCSLATVTKRGKYILKRL